jgi:hypothetical protein
MTNISTTSVWEVLSSYGDINDVLKDVPDEFYEKIKSYVRELKQKRMSIIEEAEKLFYSYSESYNNELPDKSKYAQWVLTKDIYIRPILFKMYDNKDYGQYVWKLIKPEFKKL